MKEGCQTFFLVKKTNKKQSDCVMRPVPLWADVISSKEPLVHRGRQDIMSWAGSRRCYQVLLRPSQWTENGSVKKSVPSNIINWPISLPGERNHVAESEDKQTIKHNTSARDFYPPVRGLVDLWGADEEVQHEVNMKWVKKEPSNV